MEWSLKAEFHVSAILSLSIILIPPLSLHRVLCLFSDAVGAIGRSRRTELDIPSQSGVETLTVLELAFVTKENSSILIRTVGRSFTDWDS